MSNLKFTKGANTFTFIDGREFPIEPAPTVNVVTGYSDGRQLYAYDKGIIEYDFYLVFDRIPQADHDNALNWHTNIAVGPKNAFVFTDEAGTDHTVKWMDLRFPLKEIGHGQYTGTLHLRKEV